MEEKCAANEVDSDDDLQYSPGSCIDTIMC